jgi:hypothetical protein
VTSRERAGRLESEPASQTDPAAALRAQASAAPPQPPVAASATDALERELLTKLKAELAALESLPAWTILGVSQGATEAQIRSAFFAASKRYHPHVYARYALPAIKDTVTALFISYKRAFTMMSKAAANGTGRPGGRGSDAGNR